MRILQSTAVLALAMSFAVPISYAQTGTAQTSADQTTQATGTSDQSKSEKKADRKAQAKANKKTRHAMAKTDKGDNDGRNSAGQNPKDTRPAASDAHQ